MKIKIREARKNHICFNCNEEIDNGESYYESDSLFSRKQRRLCKGCGENWLKIGAEEIRDKK